MSIKRQVKKTVYEIISKHPCNEENCLRKGLIGLQICLGAESISDFTQEWDDLFNRTCDAPPFLSRPWIETFIREGKAKGTVLFMLFWHGTELVALLPLMVREHLRVKTAQPIGTGQPSFLGLLLDPSYPEVIEYMIDAIQTQNIFDLFRIDDVSSKDNATNAFLAALERQNFSVRWRYRAPCPFIRLGCSYGEYLQNTKSGRSRRKFLWRERQLHKQYIVNIERYDSIQITDEIISRIASIQEQSWMKRRGAAVLGQPFYRKLLITMAHAGFVKAWLMTLDGCDASFVLAFINHDKLYYAWTAFKLKYASSLSIGQILTGYVISDACQDDILLFDFEHGDASYKRYWSTDEHRVYRAVAGRGFMGRLMVVFYCMLWRLAVLKQLRSLYGSLKNKLRKTGGQETGAHNEQL